MYKVYGIYDSTGLRYIGLTGNSIEERLRQHVAESARMDGTHKRHWLQSVVLSGQSPRSELLDSSDTEADALWLERLWIAVCRSCRVPLTNSCSGGGGLLNPSPEVRLKKRSVMLGRVLSEETKSKMSSSHQKDPTTRALIDNLLHPRRSRAVTAEFCERMREVARNRAPHSLETRARISASKLGSQPSEETKRRMSEAHRTRWASRTDEQKAAIRAAITASGGVGSVENAKRASAARWSNQQTQKAG